MVNRVGNVPLDDLPADRCSHACKLATALHYGGGVVDCLLVWYGNAADDLEAAGIARATGLFFCPNGIGIRVERYEHQQGRQR